MPFLPEHMHHVSREELYTSFNERLQYLHAFIEFGKADVVALTSARAFIKSLIPKVAEKVYNKLFEQDLTAQALVNQTTKQDCDLDQDDFFDKKSPNVKARHLFVRWYLTKLNSDPTQPSYWEYMNKVGAMHNGHYRRQALTIDVIHFNMMIGYVQTTLNEAIIMSDALDTRKKVALINAWSKLLWIQNDLFTKWHIKDGEEYDQTDEKASRIQFDEIMASGSIGDFRNERGDEMGCPFSGMAKLSVTEDEDTRPKYGYVYTGPGIGSIQSIMRPSVLSPMSDSMSSNSRRSNE